jgi:hypothetical protein
VRKPKKPARRQPPPAWEVYRLKSSPAAFVGLVYAEDEETAFALAIDERKIRPPITSGRLPGRVKPGPTIVRRTHEQSSRTGDQL